MKIPAKPLLRHLFAAALAITVTCGLPACDSSAPPPPAAHRSLPEQPPVAADRRQDEHPTNEPLGAGDGTQRQRQADFLNRLRRADPQFKTIDRAVLNAQNELGLVLDRSVAMDDIPALMRTMLAQMAKEFPRQDLTVVAYAPSNPPMKIGTARLDAQTRDMTYTREQP